MKLKLTFLILVLSYSSCFSQSISFSKDSLNIKWNYDNLTLSDTTWVFNVGEYDLLIDSILTKNQFGYRIYSSSFPPAYSYVVGYDKPPINLSVAPGDSVELILSDPDLCPICKKTSVQEYFTDILTFVSNSVTGKYYNIYVQGDGPSSVNEDRSIPSRIALFQNYPNPFNPRTTIMYSLSQAGFVKLLVYDILGNEVSILINEEQSSGIHETEFNAEKFSSGVYIYKLAGIDQIITRKMILLR